MFDASADNAESVQSPCPMAVHYNCTLDMLGRKGRSGNWELTAGSGHSEHDPSVSSGFRLSGSERYSVGSCFICRVSDLPFGSTSVSRYAGEKTETSDTSISLYENLTQRSRPLEKTHRVVQP